MTPFEHIMITGSIILGLAVAQILMGFADSLRLKSVKTYWPHTLWAISQLLAFIQWGFGVWIYESRSVWYGYELLLFILTPVTGFLIARFMYPHPIENSQLKQHYFDTRWLTFGVAATLMAVNTLSNSILSHYSPWVIGNLLSVVVAMIFLLLALSKDERVHKVMVPCLFLLVFASAALTGISERVGVNEL